MIDVHTHIFVPTEHFGPRLLADLQGCGIDPDAWGEVARRHLVVTQVADIAIVFGLQAAATGWHVPNDYVAAHVQTAPDRLIYFASIDPAQVDFRDELRRCHQDQRCRGIKLAPIYQGVHPLDPRYREIYTYCQRHNLPIMIHMATTFSGGTPLEYARPAHMDQVASEFPDLRIVLPHLGHPWEGETISVIRRNRNVFADVSALYHRPWQFYNSMRLLVEYRAERKVLFGSDFPFSNTGDSVNGLRNMNAILGRSGLPPIPAEVIEGILSRDALSLLGLEDPRKKPLS